MFNLQNTPSQFLTHLWNLFPFLLNQICWPILETRAWINTPLIVIIIWNTKLLEYLEHLLLLSHENTDQTFLNSSQNFFKNGINYENVSRRDKVDLRKMNGSRSLTLNNSLNTTTKTVHGAVSRPLLSLSNLQILLSTVDKYQSKYH